MENNIIAFPGANPKLVQLAKESLNNGDIKEATEYFRQAFSEEISPKVEAKIITEEQIFSDDINIQIEWTLSLDNKSIEKELPLIRKYLATEQNPILQTFILAILKAHKINEIFSVTKFAETMSIVPSQLLNPEESEFLYEMIDFIQDELENSHPSLYEQSVLLINEHNLMLFPLQLEDIENWKEAYLFYIKELMQIPQIIPNDNEFLNKLNFIKKLENYTLNFC